MTSGSDQAGRASLRESFAVEARRRLDALEAGLREETSDAEPLFRHAHTLRGSAAVVELDEIAALAAELESELRRSPDQERARQLLARLRALVEPLPTTSSPEPTRPEAGARAVLYIEDDPPNALLVGRILRGRTELAILDARTGADGLRLARERRPALVLLDLRLPDMHGLEVLERLRRDPETADLHVAVVTGGAEPDVLERVRRARVSDILVKPFDVEHLLAVVESALED